MLLLVGCASREEKIQRVQAEAEAALFESQPDDAIKILRDGLRRFPDSNTIRIALGRALAGADQLEEASQLLKEAIERDPDQDHLWVKIGEQRARLGESQQAIDAFNAYLTNHANDFLAWKALALEYEKSGNLTEAIKSASEWNDLTPSAQPALKLGELYLASGNVPQARSWFGQAAAYERQGAARDALAELIRLETSLKQFQQAIVRLEEFERRYGTGSSDRRIQESRQVISDWRRAREEIARAAAELENERRALEALRSGAQTPALPPLASNESQSASSNAPSSGERGPELQDSERPADEPAQLSTSERPPEMLFPDPIDAATPEPIEPTAPERREAAPATAESEGIETALEAIESRDYDQAIQTLWSLLGDNPDDAELWYRLSTAYFAKSEWFDAEACILEARRRAPRSERIAIQYLETILKTQNTNQALREIQTMRRQFPSDPDMALLHARTLRDANAAASVTASAYRDFIQLADRRHPGRPEATRFLQNGN